MAVYAPQAPVPDGCGEDGLVRSRKLLLLSILVLMLLGGCAERIHTPRVSSDWGRAGRVAVATRSTPMGLAVSPDGEDVFVAWAGNPDSGATENIRFLRMNQAGDPKADLALPAEVGRPRELQLLLVGDAHLHLFWIDTATLDRKLKHARVSATGDLQVQPHSVDTVGLPIQQYQAAPLPSGELLVLWTDWLGFHAVRLDGDGTLAQGPTTLQAGVIGMGLALDASGKAHIAWQVAEGPSRRVLYYAILDPDTLTLSAPLHVATAVVGPDAGTDATAGPAVALEADEGSDLIVYVCWTQRVATQIGTSERLFYVAVDSQDGRLIAGADEAEEVRIAPTFPPASVPASGSFAYRALAQPLEAAGRGARFLHAPASLPGQGGEAVLAVSAQFNTLSREEYQPTLIFMEGGRVQGYQAVTWTDHPSVDLVPAADASGNLYLAWNDVTGDANHYPVYLATTAPHLQAVWARLSWSDLLTIAGDMLDRITSGISLLPLMAIWLALPFVWLFLAMWASRGDLYGRRAMLVAFIALLVYVGSKYLLTFDILTHLPRLAYMSPEMGRVLVYVAPVLTLLASLGLTSPLFLRKGGRDRSPVLLYIVVAAVDMVLSISVYAIGYFE